MLALIALTLAFIAYVLIASGLQRKSVQQYIRDVVR